MAGAFCLVWRFRNLRLYECFQFFTVVGGPYLGSYLKINAGSWLTKNLKNFNLTKQRLLNRKITALMLFVMCAYLVCNCRSVCLNRIDQCNQQSCKYITSRIRQCTLPVAQHLIKQSWWTIVGTYYKIESYGSLELDTVSFCPIILLQTVDGCSSFIIHRYK